MKILQIAPAWVNTPPKAHGGTEWVIANLIKGLSGLGHEVTLFATKNSYVQGQLDYVFEKSFLDQDIVWNAALPAFIHYFEAFKHAQDYDLVHAHLSSGTDLIILPFLAGLSEKNVAGVMTIHSRWPFDYYSYTDKMFLKLYADKILAVNISAVMHKTLPREFRDGGFVHNSLDLDKMKFNPHKGAYLTWIGKIVPDKGTAEAIKIAKIAGEQFIFAGVVDHDVKESVRYFEEEVKPLIDGRQVQYLGRADLKLKNRLLGRAKAFISPIAWDEPFGMVVLESMACGTPVVAYNRGAMSELIRNKQTGFLAANQKEMLKAIGKIDSINRWLCRAHVAKDFSLQAAALKYLRLYVKEIESQKFLQTDRVVFSKNEQNVVMLENYPLPLSKLNR